MKKRVIAVVQIGAMHHGTAKRCLRVGHRAQATSTLCLWEYSEAAFEVRTVTEEHIHSDARATVLVLFEVSLARLPLSSIS